MGNEPIVERRQTFDRAEIRPPSQASRQTAAQVTNRNRVAYRVAREMATWLLDADLEEGARLPNEHDLCNRLGCSRSGLRSALRLLENWGLITIQSGRDGGPVARRPRVSDVKGSFAILMHSQNATLGDVLIARRAIDPIAVAEAAKNATSEHVQQLDAALARIRVPALSQREFLMALTEYDAVIIDASGLVILGLVASMLSSFGEDSVMSHTAPDREWREHVAGRLERIRNAVADHDSERARAEMALMRLESEQHWHERGPALLRMPVGPFEFER